MITRFMAVAILLSGILLVSDPAFSYSREFAKTYTADCKSVKPMYRDIEIGRFYVNTGRIETSFFTYGDARDICMGVFQDAAGASYRILENPKKERCADVAARAKTSEALTKFRGSSHFRLYELKFFPKSPSDKKTIRDNICYWLKSTSIELLKLLANPLMRLEDEVGYGPGASPSQSPDETTEPHPCPE